MEITADQARELMFNKNSDLPKKVREELNDLFALIERAAIKKYSSINTLRISSEAEKHLDKLGYVICRRKENEPTLICW